VEAGRPDSINREKLAVLKAHGVTRMAINPQTMSEYTLKRIGRNHTPADFLRAYELAAGMGFGNINCDVIMGLPGEGPADAEHTFETLARLNPASVTVHTLAMKRAAELNQVIGRYGAEAEKTAEPLKTVSDNISQMLGISRETCAAMGQKPHYMYRQKNMAGNFENVGYARDGYECIYNLQTMTEAQSVFAAGAGAVTKVIYPSINLIKRAFNVRDIAGYIGGIDEMIERKKRLLSGE
jgi:oxygen-independent coproporphyrinogen-3 oxidase